MYLFNRLRKGKIKMALGSGQFYCVSLCEEMCCIQLSILLHGKNHSAEQRIELMEYLESKLQLLMHDFMQASTKPKGYIPCFYQNCNLLHIELELLRNGEEQHCPTEENTIPDDYYCDLFPSQGL